MTVFSRRFLSNSLTVSLLAIGFAIVIPQANAQQYKVTVDTTGLNGGDNWAADFVLTNGGSTTVPSTVTVSDFLFGSIPALAGSPLGTNPPGTPVGDTTGSLSSGITLSTTSSSIYSEYAEDFTPGDSLSFTVDASGLNAPDSGTFTPDQFSFDLFDDSPSDTAYYNQNVFTASGGYELVTLTSPTSGSFDPQSFDYIGLLDQQPYSVTITQVATAPEATSFASAAIFFALLGALMFPSIMSRLSKRAL